MSCIILIINPLSSPIPGVGYCDLKHRGDKISYFIKYDDHLMTKINKKFQSSAIITNPQGHRLWKDIYENWQELSDEEMPIWKPIAVGPTIFIANPRWTAKIETDSELSNKSGTKLNTIKFRRYEPLPLPTEYIDEDEPGAKRIKELVDFWLENSRKGIQEVWDEILSETEKESDMTVLPGNYHQKKSVTGKPATPATTVNPFQQKAKELANKGGLAGAKWLPTGWKVDAEGYGVIKEPIVKPKDKLPGLGK